MHMKINLLDGIGDVGVGEGQILEGPNEAPELSRLATGGCNTHILQE
jgi:hypothetical protein